MALPLGLLLVGQTPQLAALLSRLMTGANVEFSHIRGTSLEINGVDESGAPFGRLLFSGNELSLIGFADTPKVRLASDANGSALGAISFNYLREDGVQEEVFLVIGTLAEDEPEGLGGQLEIYCRRKWDNGDAAMVRVGVISSAFTPDGEPDIRFIPDTFHTLGRW